MMHIHIKECSVGHMEGDGCFGSDVSPLHRLVGQDMFGYSVNPWLEFFCKGVLSLLALEKMTTI